MRGSIYLLNDLENMSVQTMRNPIEDTKYNITIPITRMGDYFNGIIIEGSYQDIDKVFIKISYSDTSIELQRCYPSHYHYNIFGDPKTVMDFDPAHNYFIEITSKNNDLNVQGIISLYFFKNQID